MQAAPIAVGARGNSSELVSFGGRMLPSISPTQLKQLLQGARGDALTAKGALRDLRDSSLTKLNDLAKRSASAVQKDFLDKLALGQTQVRQLADTLADTLNAISSDNVAGQAQAAAALIAANVTPVVTVHIGFGGDNHTDNNLQAEADQHVSGIQGIQAIMTALANTKDASGSPLTDKVTFATMNVFGRNLNNISKLSSTTSPGGRDHFGNHNVMVIIGKNVKPSVIGGVTADSKGTLVASGIDSATGAAVASGGDIDATKTQTSAARTLGAALGIPDSRRRQRLHRGRRRQGRPRRPGEPAQRLARVSRALADARGFAYSVRQVATRPTCPSQERPTRPARPWIPYLSIY